MSDRPHPPGCIIPGLHTKTTCLWLRDKLAEILASSEADAAVRLKEFLISLDGPIGQNAVASLASVGLGGNRGHVPGSGKTVTERSRELNVIVATGNVLAEDRKTLFGDLPVVIVPSSTTMLDLLTDTPLTDEITPERGLPIFSSRGQARKNWKGPQEIPFGWSEFVGLGKFKAALFIWKPSEGNVSVE
jgi:hypothetical protein